VIRLPWQKGASGAAEPGSEGHGPTSPLRDPRAPEPAPEPDAASPSSIRGERGAPIGRADRSLQSRMSGLLAAGLMLCVGAGMLAWYYTEALSHPTAAHGRAQIALPEAPGEGVTLPPFGPLVPPAGARPASAPPVSPSPAMESAAAEATAAQSPNPLLESPLGRAPGEPPSGYGAPPRASPRQQLFDRRLSGAVFVQSPSATPALQAADAQPPGHAPGDTQARGGGARADGLEDLLHPSVLAATRAQMLPAQHLLLAKGTFIDCTLETAIDSTLPGMTTCITATDTFSADGTVVLLERGSKLIGETRGEARQGQARVFVVWTEARTPAGVLVRLDSPGTDALGRSGLEGRVNRHFWQRFGAAALVSTIDGAVQSEVQSSSRGGTVVLDPTASEDVLTEILRSTLSIPPTIRVRNGARIQVLVARDVDFRPVYELRAR
jgi:type IV secretion system protein VirB10